MEQLADPYIQEHQSRLCLMDEIMAHARKSTEWKDIRSEIEELKRQRNNLA